MSRIVRALAVTSSPTVPSPRVAASTSSPVLVAQRAAQPVDLGLGGQRHRLTRRQVQEPPHPPYKLAHLIIAESIVEADNICRACATLASAEVGAAPSRFDGESGADEMRKLRLQLAVLADQRVIFGVGDLGRVLVVIELVVMRDQPGQAHQPVGGFRFVHSIPARSSAIFATLFMFRAVPCLIAGSFSFDLPMPSP